MAMTQRGSALPLVTCIMPTYNRRAFVPQAIRMFEAQDYPNRELIIFDDGDDAVVDLISLNPRIRYYHQNVRRSVGEKRNLACSLARGSLIVHWDDDDWHAPWRLSYQVRLLMEAGVQMCGLHRMFFYEPATAQGWCYHYPDSSGSWLAGGSLCYRRDHWERHLFEDRNIGEDSVFVRHPASRLALPRFDFYVAVIHKGNTCPKVRQGPWWQFIEEQDLLDVMGEKAFPSAAPPAKVTMVRRVLGTRRVPVRLSPPTPTCRIIGGFSQEQRPLLGLSR